MTATVDITPLNIYDHLIVEGRDGMHTVSERWNTVLCCQEQCLTRRDEPILLIESRAKLVVSELIIIGTLTKQIECRYSNGF
jgi:hypothetical protein